MTFTYDERYGETDRLKEIISGGFNYYVARSHILKEITSVSVEDVVSVVPSNLLKANTNQN